MRKLSKRFAEWVTGLKAEPFQWARVKLTLLYLAIITVIVIILSSSLYSLHLDRVGHIERRRLQTADAHEGQIASARGLGEYVEDLGRSLILADIITVGVAAVLSYVLAGRTLRPIKESTEAEQQFFANAAHDLRTPLSVLRTEAEVALRSGELTLDEARAALSSSLEEIERMSMMVEQMMNLSRRKREARAEVAFDRVDMVRLCAEVVGKLKRRAADLKVALSTSGADSAVILGNHRMLERAMYNVVENALNYTPEGGSVIVRTAREGSHVTVSVEDTGIGIAEEDLPHISEAFYRGDRARSVHSGGAGLGLTIVQTTALEHHGTLHAESRPGRGTKITLRFPAA